MTTDSQQIRKHTDRKLLTSLRLLVLISLIIMGFVAYDIFRDDANILLVVTGLAVGVLVGIAASRMYKLSWDTQGRTIIKRIDLYGLFVLLLFIAFELFRNEILSLFIAGSSSIPAVSLAVLAGALFGRTAGNARTILKMIRNDKAA